MRSLIKIPACATVLVAVLSGCGLTGGDDGEGGEGEQNGSVESGSAPEAEEVIGEGTFPYPHREGEVTVEINSLTERGDLLQMDYTLTPGAPESDADSEPSVRGVFGVYWGDMYLVDTANLRRHTVVEDDSGDSLEPHPWSTDIPYDEGTTLTAFFASAEDMESVDVYLYGLPPIMDVPVTKAEEEEDE